MAAAPTLAIMALWNGFFSGQPDMLCMAMQVIADERNDSDVSVDERVPFIALVETDLKADISR
jgi:hypothetical protein